MRALFLSLVIVFVFASYACATPTLVEKGSTGACWTEPTTNVDGGDYTDPAGYWFYCSPDDIQSDDNRHRIPDSKQLCLDYKNITLKSTVDTICRITAVNALGKESDWSNSITWVSGNEDKIPGSPDPLTDKQQ